MLDIRQEPARLAISTGGICLASSTLLARRLVESVHGSLRSPGHVPDGYSWDSHVQSEDIRHYLLPGLDSALADACDRSRPARAVGRDAGGLPGRDGAHACGNGNMGPRSLEHAVSGRARRRRHPWRHFVRTIRQGCRLSCATMPRAPRTWPPRSSTPWASIRRCAWPMRKAGPSCLWIKASRSTNCSAEPAKVMGADSANGVYTLASAAAHFARAASRE